MPPTPSNFALDEGERPLVAFRLKTATALSIDAGVDVGAVGADGHGDDAAGSPARRRRRSPASRRTSGLRSRRCARRPRAPRRSGRRRRRKLPVGAHGQENALVRPLTPPWPSTFASDEREGIEGRGRRGRRRRAESTSTSRCRPSRSASRRRPASPCVSPSPSRRRRESPCAWASTSRRASGSASPADADCRKLDQARHADPVGAGRREGRRAPETGDDAVQARDVAAAKPPVRHRAPEGTSRRQSILGRVEPGRRPVAVPVGGRLVAAAAAGLADARRPAWPSLS